MNWRHKPHTFCNFCNQHSRVRGYIDWYCPNGHIIIRKKGDDVLKEVLVPKSVGTDMKAKNTHRLNGTLGFFCNSLGEVEE